MRNINSRKLNAGLVALAALSSVLVTGCSSEGIVDAPEAEGKALQLKAAISGTTSRSFSTDLHESSFVSGEQVHVALLSPSNLSTKQEGDYSVGADGSSLTPTTTSSSIILTPETPEYKVLGIYPSDVTLPENGYSDNTWSFKVESVQNKDEDYNASDLMTAIETATYTSPSVTLNFKHRLSKIVINLSSPGNVIDVTKVNVVLTGFMLSTAPQALTDDADFTATTGSGSSILIKNYSINGSYGINENTSVCAIIPPQTKTTSSTFISINSSEYGSHTASLPANQVYKAGYVYTYNVTLTDHTVSVSSATITAWKEGTTTAIPM